MSIQRLDARLATAAGAALGAAFVDDPLVRFVAPDETRRRQAAPWCLGMVVQYGGRWGEVWGSDEREVTVVGLDTGEVVSTHRIEP